MNAHAGVTWIINLNPLIGMNVEVETYEGGVRRGKLTAVAWTNTDILGKSVKAPQHIELNNDISDYIEWRFIRSIRPAR